MDTYELVLRDPSVNKDASGPMPGDTKVVITEDQKMAWDDLKGNRFKQHPTGTTKQWIDVENGEEFCLII
jgi:hypothetical protein